MGYKLSIGMVHTFIGNLGHFFVILSFVTSLVASFCYAHYSNLQDIEKKKQWKWNARTAFYIHSASVLGIVMALFTIIYNHYFEYHYAWSHSSLHLPTHYMISCFWEGQEGSFLLWIFWHALLGLILTHSNKQWEGPVMTVFSLVQAFLASMILGVVIPGLDIKIGSSPFMLMRDVMDAPVFQMNPDYVPEDGTGLNPLLQNYWMVIHPPVLFLGYALTLVPFAYVIAGLWLRKYTEWIRPAMSWTLTGAAVLGLGIMMGAYWAYETLNFGGYWNWDPVENAVYVPWLIMIAGIHAMLIYRKNQAGLKAAMILNVATFILVLYSSFLTRSGILGDSSVHSFTDLGLYAQLLLYLAAFAVLAIVMMARVWKSIPSTEKEATIYSREFWVFIGITVLALMSFQVLAGTSIPVYNQIIEAFGGISNMAPPADQMAYYSKFQIWFAVALAIVSGTAQMFWWKKVNREKLKSALAMPLVITLLASSLVIPMSGVDNVPYIILLVAAVYALVANSSVLLNVLRSNYKLSGGAIAHIGVAIMLIGILFSAGYSRVISMNTTGLLYSSDFDDETNQENLLLFLNDTKKMDKFELTYKGQFMDVEGVPNYVAKHKLGLTDDPYQAVALKDIQQEGKTYFQKGEKVSISPENTYYAIEFKEDQAEAFTIYPRVQANESMGNVVSPDIFKEWYRDIYTHATVIPDETQEKEWSETEKYTVKVGERFFVNDYVAELKNVQRVMDVEGVTLGPQDVAVEAVIKVHGETDKYEVRPKYIIKDQRAGMVPIEINDLAMKLSFLEVNPKTNEFTIGANTTQKDYIIIKAMEKPMINLLWIGTLILLFGMSMAAYRRYHESKKMQAKQA